MNIKIKRVYEERVQNDGRRRLVDRLWPRGLSKEKAAVDIWLKEIAPSTGLRKWFGHDPAKWNDFQKRYIKELDANPEPVKIIKDLAKKGAVTLLYGAKDEEHNDAVVLLKYLIR